MLALLHDNIGDRISPTVTSAAAGFPLINLLDGSRHSFWKATGTGTQDIVFDAGIGKTVTADYVALARADLLVGTGSTVIVEHSANGSAWTACFVAVTLGGGDLFAPFAEDWLKLFTPATDRFFRLRITGSSSAPIFAGLWLGARSTLSRSASETVTYGVSRAIRGADLQVPLRYLTEVDAALLEGYAQGVTPNWPAEQPLQTDEGAIYGARPHFVYDSLGKITRRADGAVPVLLNVLLVADVQLSKPLLTSARYMADLQLRVLR